MKTMRALASKVFIADRVNQSSAYRHAWFISKEPCVTISPLLSIVGISWPTVCIKVCLIMS